MMRTGFLTFLLAATSFAQQNSRPASQPKPLLSPEVLADRSVVFRLRAPDAHDVTVAGDFWLQQGRTEALHKDDQGVWSLTTEPLTPDYYSYFFTIDGVHVPDPANPSTKPGVPEIQSTFLVPGPETSLLFPGPEPHGDIRTIYYTAGSLHEVRRMHLYLPPGYDQAKTRYPVAYLFHGGGDDDGAWESIGRVNFILDKLIAEGKARPMIVVMPSLWAINPPVPKEQSETNEQLFRKTLVSDVIPFVESHYRVLPGPENRAVGGLGIGRAFLPNFVWPTLGEFGTVLFVSGGADAQQFSALQKQYPGVIDDPSKIHSVKFFMGDGAHDASLVSAKNTVEQLKQRGYNVHFVESETTHGWPGFRYVFEQFAQAAFR